MAQNQSLQAVGAKIRCRYGVFVPKEEYQTLASLPSLSEFTAALGGFPLYASAGKIPASSLTGNHLADYLEQQYWNDLASLFRFDLFLGSPLYQLLIWQFTLETVLSFARHHNRGAKFTPPRFPGFFEKRLGFDLNAFALCNEYPQIIPLFAGHPFQKGLAANIPVAGTPVNIARLEQDLMGIQLQYIKKEFLQNKGNEQLGEIFSLMIDLENLQKLLRCKGRFTTFSAGETPRFLEGGSFSPKQLASLFSLPEKQLEKELKSSPYGQFLASDLPADFALEGLLYSRCRKIIRTTHHIPTMLFAYCLLGRHQKDCLTVIARGIAYGMPQSDIMKLLAI